MHQEILTFVSAPSTGRGCLPSFHMDRETVIKIYDDRTLRTDFYHHRQIILEFRDNSSRHNVEYTNVGGVPRHGTDAGWLVLYSFIFCVSACFFLCVEAFYE